MRLKQKLFTNTIIVLGLSRRQMAAIITQLESARTTFPLYYYHQTFVRTYEGTSQIAKLPSPFPIHYHHEQYSNSVQRKQFVKDICIPYYSYASNGGGNPVSVVRSWENNWKVSNALSVFHRSTFRLSCLWSGLAFKRKVRIRSDRIKNSLLLPQLSTGYYYVYIYKGVGMCSRIYVYFLGPLSWGRWMIG